ncbi:rubredoxin reductase [Gordonia rubripertincta]|uniref:rubredoxin reductase n=1 Tax=Gordonia rubripertincta TaxID=36822 RepID=UPI000B8D51BE|nr:rubredoxin reductase [Gordonia rubripertincta]ASR02802.1 hypothetical protein GCWB2_10000 [Gordonia rubripertincta]
MTAGQWLTATERGKLVAMTIATDLGLAPGPATPLPGVPLARSMQSRSNIPMVGWPTIATPDGDVDTTVRPFDDDDRLVGAVRVGRDGAGRSLRSEIGDAPEPVGAAGR